MRNSAAVTARLSLRFSYSSANHNRLSFALRIWPPLTVRLHPVGSLIFPLLHCQCPIFGPVRHTFYCFPFAKCRPYSRRFSAFLFLFFFFSLHCRWPGQFFTFGFYFFVFFLQLLQQKSIIRFGVIGNQFQWPLGAKKEKR